MIIGGLALVVSGQQNIGVLATVLLGWIGSIIGSFIGYRVIHTGRLLTLVLEIAAAALLIAVHSRTSASTLAGRGRTMRW